MKKFLVAFLVLIVAACGEDDPKLSVEELLTKPSNGWIQTSVLVTIPGTTTKVDVYSDPDYADVYLACDKDDAVVFKADGKYSVENSVKCDNTEPAQLETGTWKLSSDQKTVTFTPAGGDVYSASILEISETEMKVDITLEFGSTPISATITMKPK
jgi:hypothetical protein